MGVTSNRHWMITALLALFVAMFVLVPVADAATCAFEAEPAHMTSALAQPDQPDQPDDRPSGDHGLCAHGHCHHSGMVLPQPTHAGVAKDHAAALDLKPTDAPLASHSPSGLKRPPRG